jgi:hypothetical protein
LVIRKKKQDWSKQVNKNFMIKTIASSVLILALSACGGSTEVTSRDGENIESPAVESPRDVAPPEVDPGQRVGEDFQDALPISSQLGFGTFLLEGSEFAVDPAQATELLPLWKAARSLSESETAAEGELEAVFNQIEDTMNSEQIAFIAELRLTGEEMAQLMEDIGLEFGLAGPGFGNLTPEQQATAQAARESGEGFPGGGFFGGNPGGGPGGGQGPGGGEGFGGGNITPEQQATLEARRTERGGGFGARFALIFADPLIELLEERAAE